MKQKELKHWKHVTADMMSEEEESGDCFYSPSTSVEIKNGGKNGGSMESSVRNRLQRIYIPDWMKESNTAMDAADGGIMHLKMN